MDCEYLRVSCILLHAFGIWYSNIFHHELKGYYIATSMGYAHDCSEMNLVGNMVRVDYLVGAVVIMNAHRSYQNAACTAIVLFNWVARGV